MERESGWRLGCGLKYQRPFSLQTDTRVYVTDDHLEINIEIARDIPLTRSLSLSFALETRWAGKTIAEQEIGKGWNYLEPSARLVHP